MKINWSNIDELEDHFITYLLYEDSFTVPQISRIRNKSIEEVNEDLIKSKLSLRKKDEGDVRKENDIIKDYLSMNKEDRLNFIKKMGQNELAIFKNKVYSGVINTSNMDDLIIFIWTCGELRDERFLKILYPLVEKNSVSIRRIAYSAIGKISSPSSKYILELGLIDENPQVRQYCAKHLASIGDRKTIEILENIINRKAKFEKAYVIEACRLTLDALKKKFGEKNNSQSCEV